MCQINLFIARLKLLFAAYILINFIVSSLFLKEKDIISATSQMKELSDRLRQLDSRCKECQDREKEALKERNEWKQKCEDSAAELQSLRSRYLQSYCPWSRIILRGYTVDKQYTDFSDKEVFSCMS